MSNVVIFDLDGTLADLSGRLHLLPKEGDRDRTECWDEFNLACSTDKLIHNTAEVIRNLHETYEIVILTGRCDIARELTQLWLAENAIPYDHLFMRAEGDHRVDTTIKQEVVEQIGVDNILCAFDDLPHVVEHLRSLGITTYHVGDVCKKYNKLNEGAGE